MTAARNPDPGTHTEEPPVSGGATCVVFRAGNPAEAFALGDRLSKANIPYSIQEKWSFAYDGVWGLSGGGDWGHLVVFQHDQARAAEVVDDFLGARAGASS